MNDLSESLTDICSILTKYIGSDQSKLASIAAVVISTAAVLAPCAYHMYLLHKFPGEVHFAFSYLPILGHAIDFGTNPIGLLQRLSKDANGAVKEIMGLVLAGKRVCLINDPNSFKMIFKSKKEMSFDTFSRKVLIDVFGATEETTYGVHIEAEPHSRVSYNKYLLSEDGCTALTERMQEKLATVVRELPAEATVEMMTFFNRIIYTASAAALFNNKLAENDKVFKSFIDFDDMFALALSGIPECLRKKGVQGRECVLEHICKDRNDISDFMNSRYEMLENKFNYPARDLQANHLSMLWASVGNTMPGTYWTMVYVLRSPSALQAVLNELHQILGDRARDPDLVISVDEMNQMVILNSCISEALRLSSGSLIMREVVEPCTLTLSSGNTYTFRKGDNVGIFPPLLHKDSRIYKNPDEFQYDRFVNVPAEYTIEGASVQSSLCFIPFGGGVSYCPGRKFARNEIKTLVAQLFLRFQVTFENPADASKPLEMDYSRAGLGIFFPKNGNMKLKIKRLL